MCSIAEVKIGNKIFCLVRYLFYTMTASVALKHVSKIVSCSTCSAPACNRINSGSVTSSELAAERSNLKLPSGA